MMNRKTVKQVTVHFAALTRVVPLHPIRSEQDYDKAVSVVEKLLDHGGADEAHPLANLVGILGQLIADYDNSHFPIGVIASPAQPIADRISPRHSPNPMRA